MDEVSWQCKPFAELTTTELYAIIRLRNEVFVVVVAQVFSPVKGFNQIAKLGVEQGVDGGVVLGGNDFGALEQIAVHCAREVDGGVRAFDDVGGCRCGGHACFLANSGHFYT